jgi:hypothetical protein
MSAISSACSPVSGCDRQQVVHVHAQLLRVDRIQRVLGIDEGAVPPGLLALGDGLQGQRGLAGGFRTIDLDHATLGQAADAQRDVQHQRAGTDGLDRLDDRAVAHAHHRALAELLLDLAQGGGKGALLVLVHGAGPRY